jgi:hypothetical protein
MQRFISKFLLLLISLTILNVSHAQTVNPNWKQDLSTSLDKFLKCNPSSGESPCNGFVGESLYTVYRLKDFQSTKTGKYMTVNEIAAVLKENDKWTPIGHAYDQKVLTQAQQESNSKKAVVALYLNPAGIGHVVLILPGELQNSGSWGLKVPNSASFLLSEPSKSYSEKPLSFALGKNLMKDIVIYIKKY